MEIDPPQTNPSGEGSEEMRAPSYGFGIVLLLIAVWLVHEGRSAASGGDVIPTEFGAGWIAPSTAYVVAGLCFSLGTYLFVAYFRWTRRNR